MTRLVLVVSIICFFSSNNFSQIKKNKDDVVKKNNRYSIDSSSSLYAKRSYSPNEMNYFTPQDYYDGNLVDAAYTLAPNNDVFIFWIKKNSSFTAHDIYLSKSSNNGSTWYSTELLQSVAYTTENYFYVTSIITSSGRVMLIYNQHAYNSVGSFYKIYSDDSGNTWSSPQLVITGFGSIGRNPILSRTSDGNLWLCYNRSDNSIRFRTSTDSGVTWSAEKTFQSSVAVFSGSIISLENQRLGIVYGSNEATGYKINVKTSIDNGTTWSSPDILYSSNEELKCIRALNNSAGHIYVAFDKPVKSIYDLPNLLVNYPQVYEYSQSDILFIKNVDNGISWSSPEPFTRYLGYDGSFNIGLLTDKPFVIFQSTRGDLNVKRLWYGVIEINGDEIFPPIVPVLGHVKPIYNIPVIINSLILNVSKIQSAILDVFTDGIFYSQLNLFDDGLHSDGIANDSYWGNTIGPFDPLVTVEYRLTVIDSLGNQIIKWGPSFNLINYLTQAYELETNKIRIPILNNGFTAHATDVIPETGGWFEEGRFLFSGGFLLSGYSNDSLWVNGAASSSRIQDYFPGPTGILPNPINTKLYILKESDTPFAQSWQDWTIAVDLGADFYDGNGDSIYSPIDLNSNGQWDSNEDRPGLIGDETIFCIYNDGIPSNFRRFYNMKPMGIEVRQTVYAFHSSEYSLDHSIFIRYQIVNKGQYQCDSVYFSAFADADIGENYVDDLFGSDTNSFSGYTYKTVSDSAYGINPPAFFLSLLQCPAVFIPGDTFIDNNLNGIFDPGIDSPIDSAFDVRGSYMGIDTIPGAKNLTLNSSMHYMSSHPTMGDPNDIFQVRFLQLGGLTPFGLTIDPCNWAFGNVLGGVNCTSLNSKFLYSGNPETHLGWLNTTLTDQLALESVGPFDLNQNQSVDVIVAYSVGRGSSGVNSVTVGKQNIYNIINAFKQNFPVTVRIEDEADITELDFRLYQNFPNPFNPSTKISWQSPVSSWQTLKVYDVLGNEVATLVNEYKPAGSYEIEFNPVSSIRNLESIFIS